MGKDLSAEVVFRKVKTLNHGAHSAIEYQNALLQLAAYESIVKVGHEMVGWGLENLELLDNLEFLTVLDF